MGGRAFIEKYGVESKRIQLNEYVKLCSKVKEILEQNFYRVHLIQGFTTKKDFGDADFLVTKPRDENKQRLYREELGASLSVNNSNISSYLIDGFQVDVIHCNRNYFDTSIFYYDYDPVGNLQGKLYHKFRLCLGYNGLSYILRDNENTYKLGVVEISQDQRKITEFLGLDYEWRSKGFATQEEIFKYIISSKYFDARIFSYENMNHIARTRDRKRDSYRKFMDYIKPYETTTYNWPLVEERLEYVDQYFPESNLLKNIKFLKEKRQKAQLLADKFNGELVINWIGITGKELGNVLGQYKKAHFDIIEKETAEDVKRHFLDWYKKELTS
jgi:hypothetical protein